MKGFDFRARYMQKRREMAITVRREMAITVMNLIIIMGSGVLFIEEGKEKGTGKEKIYFSS